MPKIVKGKIYVHRDYTEGVVPADVIAKALYIIKQGGHKDDYTYVRYDPETPRVVMLGWCTGWDTFNEPVISKTITVDTWNRSSLLSPASTNPQIIHGKHLFVNEDTAYEGFDVEEARERFNSYQNADWLDRLRMGRLNWWRDNAIDKLRRTSSADA
jgi:hypothetical protein